VDKCPVCNKKIIEKNNCCVLDGIVYFFCCKECDANFTAEPRKYINCCEVKKEK